MATRPNDRFILRPFRQDDAPHFATAVNESIGTVGVWMDWATPGYGEREALEWFAICDTARSAGTAHEFGLFTADGLLVGGAGLNQFNAQHRFCNLGYWVRQSSQRQGAATAAVASLARLAFGQLHLSRIEIVVADGNVASEAVARRAGAAHECLARNRLQLHGSAVAAHVFALIPSAA